MTSFINYLVKVDDQGSWITINGTHVHLGADGAVDKGPEGLVGSKPSVENIHDHLSEKCRPKISEDNSTIKAYLGRRASSPINDELRKGGVSKSILDDSGTGGGYWNDSYNHTKKALIDFADNAKKSFDASSVATPTALTVYRGMAFKAHEMPEFGDLKTGSIITDKGLVSTTTNSAHAGEFSSGTRRSGAKYRGTTMEISVPKGTMVVATNDPAPGAGGLGEREIVLRPDTQFKVIKYVKSKNYLSLEVISS